MLRSPLHSSEGGNSDRLHVHCQHQCGCHTRHPFSANLATVMTARESTYSISVTSHFLEFPYAICVEGYLRGRHQLIKSCTLKMGTMKARIEVRLDYSSFACNVRHGAPCSYQWIQSYVRRVHKTLSTESLYTYTVGSPPPLIY